MITTPLPINEKPYYNTDSVANSLAADDMFDCYLEPVPGLGFITRRRPGLRLFADLGPAASDGIFSWDAMGWPIVVNAGKVYRLDADGTATQLTGAEFPATGRPVVFADGQNVAGDPWLYMANGALRYTTGATVVAPTYNYLKDITPSPTGIASGVTNTIHPGATGPDPAAAVKVRITNPTAADYSGTTATIAGTNLNGVAQSGTLTLPAAGAYVETDRYYKTIATITFSGALSGAGVNIGWPGAQLTTTSEGVPEATHVAFMTGAFLANHKGTNRFSFTDTNPVTGVMEPDFWGATDNPLTCEARGDLLLALFTAWQEVNAWGSQGLEIWHNDGVTPFSPVPDAFTEGGLEAPYSVVIADNTAFALCVIAGARVVIKMQGRAPVAVSEPIARVLAEMPRVNDAVGTLISVGGLAIYLLSFPSAGQTWAYDYKNDVWCRWGYFIDGEHQQFLGLYSCYVKAWGKHLITSRLDGKIYELDRGCYQDGDQVVVSYRRTGWMDHGTYNRKACSQFYVKCKAGVADTATLLLRWRDDGREEWAPFIEIQLSPVGLRDFIAKLNRLGLYRSRQYEFRLTDPADLALVGASATVEARRS